MRTNIAPLNSTFFLMGMIGFLISIFYIPQFSVSWAFAFAALFFMMLIASFISMVRAKPKAQLQTKL